MTALAGTFSCLFGFEEADYSQNECACVLLHMRGINTVGCDVSGLLKRKRCRPASARNHVFCSSEPKTYTHTHPAKQTHTSTLFLLQKINLYYCLVCLRRTSFQWFVGFYVVSQIEKKTTKKQKAHTLVPQSSTQFFPFDCKHEYLFTWPCVNEAWFLLRFGLIQFVCTAAHFEDVNLRDLLINEIITNPSGAADPKFLPKQIDIYPLGEWINVSKYTS